MCRASKTLATEWDKGDKKSCEMKEEGKKKNETNLAKGEKQSGAELLKNIYNIWLQVQITSTTERRCIDV